MKPSKSLGVVSWCGCEILLCMCNSCMSRSCLGFDSWARARCRKARKQAGRVCAARLMDAVLAGRGDCSEILGVHYMRVPLKPPKAHGNLGGTLRRPRTNANALRAEEASPKAPCAARSRSAKTLHSWMQEAAQLTHLVLGVEVLNFALPQGRASSRRKPWPVPPIVPQPIGVNKSG